MFERFTDRARKTMAEANQEAHRLNHEYIGTEHLLLGLIKERSGVAVSALQNLNMDLGRVRCEVENLAKPGPETLTMGKLPQTPRAKKVIEEAINAAREMGHNYVGTEHVLLGLLRERDGIAAQVLMDLGLRTDMVRAEVQRLLGAGSEHAPGPATASEAQDLTGAAKPWDVPATAPGASAVELLDLNRRVARLEGAAGRLRRTGPLLRLLLAWTIVLSVVVPGLMVYVVTRTR